ncbi:MAG: HTH domain-containing protein [Steroidobacteraceae bacterium]
MRASRLLRILLALQNRGRLTTLQLANELEVARRTILRDIDALTEAGLPVIVHRGYKGGVELAFNYRSRLVGLDAEEAEALGVILSAPNAALAELDIRSAAQRVRDKLVESLPEIVRNRVQDSQRRFRFAAKPLTTADPRVAALADAIRRSVVVRIQAKSSAPRTIHPVALQLDADGWAVFDARERQTPIPHGQWGDINISARQFAAQP